MAAMLPASISAYDFKVDGIYYNINGNEAIVTSGTSQYYGDVVIPAAVTYNGTTYSITAIGERAFENCHSLMSVSIPNSVNAIKNIAFWGCSGLTSIIIPNSVTTIGERAFYGCSGLTIMTVDSGNPKYDSRNNCNAIIETSSNVLTAGCKGTVIPNTVTSIGYSAFGGCHDLTSMTIPSSVTAIRNCAFEDCSSLTNVTIPNSITSIGGYVFDNCNGLTSIVVEGGNPRYDSRDNCNAIIETASNTLKTGCQSTVIPNTVTAIGDYAFRGCLGLTSIDIPNSVLSIGRDAFHGCRSLKSVTFGNSLTTIDYYAFDYCRSLKSVTIPSSVTSIGIGVFNSCDSLASITVESGNPIYDSRNNCNAIIETSNITLVVGCKNTVIPDSVTSISGWAFDGCSGLTSITIPKTVTYIGSSAFFDCIHLAEVYSYIVDPSAVTMSSSAFYQNPGGADYSYRTLHVPHGTAAAYQADENWSLYFGQIVEMEPETGLKGDVNLDGDVDFADVNAVVDIIMGENGNTTAADVNGDGEINIADINALIHIIVGAGGSSPDEHEWVDLGLPSGTLWATCNVGASAPEEYGDYFAWGETEPKDNYDWSNYKWCNGSRYSLTKYCSSVDGKTELDPDDDAATVNWGSSWCMPTLEQLQELCDNCTWQWTSLNGVMGCLVIGPNGNSIFLPASGGYSSHAYWTGENGYYWSRTRCSLDKWNIPNEGEGQNDAYIQFFGRSRKHIWYDVRCDGQIIRAVRVTPTESQSLYIKEQSLDLGAVPVGTTRTGELTIVNNTSLVQTLTVSVDEPFSLKQEQGTASCMTIDVPANSLAKVTVMYTATAPGEFNGTAAFLNPALDGGQSIIPLQAQSIPQCDYVDLGLPSGTLWATCNVGASAPEEYGDYFAWGETEPKEVYNWETYKWCNCTEFSLTKYCTNSNFGTVDNTRVLDLEDDAAYVNMGPSWRMPSEAQQVELFQKCTWQWKTMNGVNGRLITGPNGNSIFLPAAGERFYSLLLDAGSMSDYWSRELSSGNPICAKGIRFKSDDIFWLDGARAYGKSVRAVHVSQ